LSKAAPCSCATGDWTARVIAPTNAPLFETCQAHSHMGTRAGDECSQGKSLIAIEAYGRIASTRRCRNGLTRPGLREYRLSGASSLPAATHQVQGEENVPPHKEFG
jgi:hypothetical protein